jgi:hypothetical protein
MSRTERESGTGNRGSEPRRKDRSVVPVPDFSFPVPVLLVVLAACAPAPRDAPHGTGAARAALENPAFAWRSATSPAVHLHYLPRSPAEAHVRRHVRAAEEARARALRLLRLPPPREPLELFLVNTREQAAALAGAPRMGQAVPGELTAVFVVREGTRVPFRHEVAHALSLHGWGPMPAAGPWLQEGVATWAGGECQGKPVSAIAAGFAAMRRLPPLSDLTERFWEVDELRAYTTSASLVEFLVRTRGPGELERLWKRGSGGPHPLDPDGPAAERAWLAHLARTPYALVDTVRLRREGC